MSTVLVTGARGLLGSTLMQTLSEAGMTTIALESDLRNREEVMKEVERVAPQAIVHAAACTDVAYCEAHPEDAHAVNVLGTRTLVEAAKTAGARIIYISTASVFDGHEGNYREEDAPAPQNIYSRTKLEGEQEVARYERGLTLRLVLIGVHKNGSRGKNFIEWILDQLRTNTDMTLFMDARMNALSNWTVARYIGRILTEGVETPVLHLGSRDIHSKADVGKLIAGRFPGYTGTLREASISTIQDGVRRPKEMWLNTDKAVSLLGLMPTLTEELACIEEHGGFTIR